VKHDLQLVFGFIEENRDQMASALSRLIRAPSVRETAGEQHAETGQGIRQALEVVQELSQSLGFRHRRIGDWVALADMGDGAETVGALLHLDVVPPGEGWTQPPYSGAIVDGEVWGRGAQDDKGPTISVLFAAHAVLRSGVPLKRCFRMIFGTDEESGIWQDIDKYLEAESPRARRA